MAYSQKRAIEIQPFSVGPMTGFLAGGYDLSRIETYLPDMDALFSCRDCRIIKDFGNTKTAVVSLDLRNGAEGFVLKMFKPKGFSHQLSELFGQSGASKVWSTSYKLLGNDIPIPEPVAMVEKRRYGFLICSYFLSLYVEEAVNLREYVNSSGTGSLDDGRFMANFGRALGKMHLSNLIHGDLKWSNLLIIDVKGEPNPIFTDLDHVRFHKRLQNADRAKDLARFMVDVQEMGLNSGLSNIFLEAYFDAAIINDTEIGSFLKQLEKIKRKIINRHERAPKR